MSLLDDSRDTIKVYREIDGTDSLDNPIKVPDLANPVTVYGRVQPSSSGETDDQNSSTFYTFRGRKFPGGTIARVDWVNHGGWPFDVEGEPLRTNGSDRTRHVVVSLKARIADPLED